MFELMRIVNPSRVSPRVAETLSVWRLPERPLLHFVHYILICLLGLFGCAGTQQGAIATGAEGTPASYSESATGVLVIDVRTPSEYEGDHAKGAINIPHTEIEKEIGKYAVNKDQKILLYCLIGKRAGIALKALKKIGYRNVVNIGGCDEAEEMFEWQTD